MSRRRRWKENKRLSRAFRVTWRLTFVQRELVRSRSRINTIEGKKEKEEERKKSESRSIDRSILRFGWCAIARRLSLTASTSASTSRSLHTDRGICYLVFATTRSEALARVRFAHAPPCLPILRTESARSPPPSSLFPYGGRRESGQSLLWSASLSSSPSFSTNSFPLEFEFWELGRKSFPLLLLSPARLFFLHLRREQRNERVPPLPSDSSRIPRGVAREDLNIGEDRFLFFFFPSRNDVLLTLFLSLTLETEQSPRDRLVGGGEGERHRSSSSIRLFQFARASQSHRNERKCKRP